MNNSCDSKTKYMITVNESQSYHVCILEGPTYSMIDNFCGRDLNNSNQYINRVNNQHQISDSLCSYLIFFTDGFTNVTMQFIFEGKLVLQLLTFNVTIFSRALSFIIY